MHQLRLANQHYGSALSRTRSFFWLTFCEDINLIFGSLGRVYRPPENCSESSASEKVFISCWHMHVPRSSSRVGTNVVKLVGDYCTAIVKLGSFTHARSNSSFRPSCFLFHSRHSYCRVLQSSLNSSFLTISKTPLYSSLASHFHI